MKEKLKNIGLIVLAVLLAISVGVGVFFFIQKQAIISRENEARVVAQNRIAELSRTLKEGRGTWSRLAQERQADISALREQNSELSSLIESRNEEIQNLTTAVATLRNIRVRVDRENIDQTPVDPIEPGDPDRLRVNFDQVWEDFIRVSGHTITSPAEAEVAIEFIRPVSVQVVTTQREDFSWNSYVSIDIPGLEIGNIETTVNPISRPAEQRDWYDDIWIGVGGAVGIQGNSGTAHVSFGYDFGNWDAGVSVGGIFSSAGVDFGLGIQLRIQPFDL